MKLESIEVFPNSKFGWQSDKLVFGKDITHLYGPNGCGKTPVIQSILFCLGYPSVFREDIYRNCHSATLTSTINDKRYKFTRVFSRDVDVRVVDGEEGEKRFYAEDEYSRYLFQLFNLSDDVLVTSRNAASKAYMATLLPIFYLDQDSGYANIYSPPASFIKDQFSEMMRIVFSLPPKHPFNAKKLRINVKAELDVLDHAVYKLARDVEASKKNASGRELHVVDQEMKLLEEELAALKTSNLEYDESIAVIDRLIVSSRTRVREFDAELAEIEKRRVSFAKIAQEISTEINTLNLNEEAKRVFLSFSEICGSANCRLFESSSESYGKNLLYLKDQIKDLERNSELDKKRAEECNANKKLLGDQVNNLLNERATVLEGGEVAALVAAIGEVQKRIVELQVEKGGLQEVVELENKYLETVGRRNSTLEKYKSLGVDANLSPEVIRLRSGLRDKFLKWLDVLNTRNISRDISFRSDFVPVLGEETVTQLKGSTRTRVILAFHAATLELLASNASSPLKLLVLDTPKQHEIHNDDLDKYVRELKQLAMHHGVQVIFSTTEYHYDGDADDAEWTPQHPGENQKMFFRQLTGE